MANGAIPVRSQPNLNGNRITNLADGIDAQDAVTINQLTTAPPKFPFKTVNSNTLLNASTDYTVIADTSGGNVILTLPVVHVIKTGFELKNGDLGIVTVALNGSLLDRGAADFTLNPDESITLRSDGTDWWIV